MNNDAYGYLFHNKKNKTILVTKFEINQPTKLTNCSQYSHATRLFNAKHISKTTANRNAN